MLPRVLRRPSHRPEQHRPHFFRSASRLGTIVVEGKTFAPLQGSFPGWVPMAFALGGFAMPGTITHEDVQATIQRLKEEDPGLGRLLRNAYGYAVFPSVGKAAAVVGG